MKKIFEINNKNSIDNLIDNNLEKELKSINNTLKLLLITEKNKIENHLEFWDKYKKFTNKYEFIYSSYNYKYKSVLNINKISRSYFKLWEILNDNLLINKYEKKIKIANIAEAPGGFMEAIIDYFKYFDKTTKPFLYGISLLNKNDRNIPNWKLKKNCNIYVNSINDNIGDLYNYKNITKFINLVQPNSCKLITCDGGFDINNNYENQEKLLNKLILCEIYMVINLQKNNGNAIIKCFDLFSEESMLIIYILSLFYSKIKIIKPLSSRPANSEKYLLCENFDENKIVSYKNIIESLKNYLYFDKQINIIIPTYLKLLITEYNIYYTHLQINSIVETINLIENLENNHEEKILIEIYNKNLVDCKLWCKKYKLL